MKKLKIWSMMMLMAMALPTIVACGGDDGDDDENGGKLPLTVENIKGSWSTGYASNYQGYYKYITFYTAKIGIFLVTSKRILKNRKLFVSLPAICNGRQAIYSEPD